MSDALPIRRINGLRGILLLILAAFAAGAVYIWHDDGHFAAETKMKAEWLLALAALIVVMLFTFAYGFRRKSEFHKAWGIRRTVDQPIDVPKPDPFRTLRAHLQAHYSLFARHRHPWLLVIGQASLAHRHFPDLVRTGWLDTPQAVLIWAGEGAVVPAGGWSRLRGRVRRPAEGIVVVSDGTGAVGEAASRLAQDCGYALPVSLLVSPALPGERLPATEPIIALPGTQVRDSAAWRDTLRTLSAPLADSGVQALMHDPRAAFDAALSRWLEQHESGLARWLAQQAARLHRRQIVSGVWFAPAHGMGRAVVADWAATEGGSLTGAGYSFSSLSATASTPSFSAADTPSSWTDAAAVEEPAGIGASGALIQLPVAWLRAMRRAGAARLRWRPLDWVAVTAVAACVGAVLGMTISYGLNRAEIEHVRETVASLVSARDTGAAFSALDHLQAAIARLDDQREHGAPWLARFGLNRGTPLLATAWPAYRAGAQAWFVQPAQAQLGRELQALGRVPLDQDSDLSRTIPDPRTSTTARETAALAATDAVAPDSRTAIGQRGYDTLKAWLMLAQPEHAEAAFLTEHLAHTARSLWPAQSPARTEALATFYAAHLASHPDWRLSADADTLFIARQTLTGLIDLKQAEDTLYSQLLAETKSRYADPSLASLLAGRDARGLWSVQGRLPGAFTRQAYEGYVQEAIAQLARQRASQTDWVLGQQTAAVDATPEQMQARLTHRYFTDFAYAWQSFLNRILWVPENTLAGSSEQLRVYADAQQSPLAALIKTVAWQAQTGQSTRTLADTLGEKAKNLFKRDDGQTPAAPPPAGPLQEAFAPLLRLAGTTTDEASNAANTADGGSGITSPLSLQRYLERVSASRLKLDQVSAAADPDAYARQLAQRLFQGRASELMSARDYAEQLAASLGSAYAGMGQNLFVRPLDQGWRTLLQPAQASLNSLWQASVLAPWNDAFTGRYPFAASESEVSLAELARFIGPQGAIGQFAQTQLGGILERQGDQWVPNPLYVQSLHFDVDFLNALNKLSWLASRLYAEGDARTRFDVMALGNPQITDSDLSIDGQTLHYFNQKPQWQRMVWPGQPELAGASLTWRTLATGLRAQQRYEGTWALVRLLAQAKAEQVDRSNWRLDWTLDDSEHLRYALRTQAGAGPLEVLQLQGFKLPQRVFVTGKEAQLTPKAVAATASAPVAYAGR